MVDKRRTTLVDPERIFKTTRRMKLIWNPDRKTKKKAKRRG